MNTRTLELNKIDLILFESKTCIQLLFPRLGRDILDV